MGSYIEHQIGLAVNKILRYTQTEILKTKLSFTLCKHLKKLKGLQLDTFHSIQVKLTRIDICIRKRCYKKCNSIVLTFHFKFVFYVYLKLFKIRIYGIFFAFLSSFQINKITHDCGVTLCPSARCREGDRYESWPDTSS